MFKESLKMSWQNIIHNKMRSFLTVLGIVIGVSSIIALITIIQSVTESVTSKVSGMGANKIMVQAYGTPLKKGLTDVEVNKLTEIDNIKGVSPTLSGETSIVYGKTVLENVKVQGNNQVHFKNTEDLMESGRAINKLDCDDKNRVCIIGQDIKEKLFSAESPLDKELKINGIAYTVVGTLQKTSGYTLSGNDTSVIIPYTTAMRLLGVKAIGSVDLYMENGRLADSTTADIERVLNTAFNYHKEGYLVYNMQNILDVIKEMTSMMTMMLAGIAAISLVVGGIGIMNMMLVSVTERTAEIGLRKALGAEPKRIQQQFLLEALFLSLFGGIIGLIFGVGIAFLVCILIDSGFTLSLSTFVLAIGFSAAIGVIFGFAPARKASRLNPIDALRSV